MFLCLCVYRRYSTSYAGIGEIMKFGFLIDHCKCTGCHACSVACKEEHQVPLGVYRAWVKHVEKGAFPNTRRHQFGGVQRGRKCMPPFTPSSHAAGLLTNYPPVERWDDWAEYDSAV